MPLRGRELGTFLLLTLIWGTTWAAIRLGLAGIPPFAGVAIRFLVAGAVLYIAAMLRRERLGAKPHERALWLFNGFATFVVPYGLIYWAEQRVPSGLASVLFATFPLWLVLWSRWLLPEERASRGLVLGVVLGFAGVAVIFSEDFDKLGGAEVRTRGFTLLAAAAISATGSLAVKRWGKGITPLSFSAVPMLLAGSVCGGASLLFESGPVVLTWKPVVATLYLALIGSALSFTLYFWLLARRSAVLASMISYTAPVVAVIVGVILFGEPVTGRMIAGGLLVLGGVAGVLRSH
jgi:drug/metabolite transporter (DMT)-like permease